MTVDGVIFQNIDKIIERGKRLGIVKEGTRKPEMGEILYIDMIWRVLNLSHEMDTESEEFEIKHKKMLQYGNLNKILATYEQVRAKKNEGKKEEGILAQIAKKYAEEERKEIERNKRKFNIILEKVARGESITEEEQIIYDAGIEAGEAEVI